MSEVKPQVYVLAENRLFREALTRILSKKTDIRVAGAAAPKLDVLQSLSEIKPDILLSDPTILVASENPLFQALRTLLPEVRVIMIGMDPDPELFLLAVRQGVIGYVLKDASAVEVASAVRAVVNHEAVCPAALLSSLFKAVACPPKEVPTSAVKRELGLSRREQQLTQMISEGLTNKEIASRLNLAEQTVKNHVHRMLKKVGASDRLVIVERWREVRRRDYNSFSQSL
jgi:two-component system nitrate/nitrite response regulator NarL